MPTIKSGSSWAELIVSVEDPYFLALKRCLIEFQYRAVTVADWRDEGRRLG